jgi:isopenicillin N synthase-like dioxygenase
MELWSGETYRATLHRVVFPSSTSIDGAAPARDRFSIAYFVQADDDVVKKPNFRRLPSTGTKSRTDLVSMAISHSIQ